MANNRLEELRRRAQERIQQVREQMERGEDVSPSAPVDAPPPPPFERLRASTPSETYQPSAAQQSPEGPSPEGRSLETPGYEVQLTQLEPTRQETLRPSSASQAPQRGPAASTAGQRERRSGAAKVLNRDTLRQVMLAREILGKPVSQRSPQENEDL